jgi:hypothetical protein
MRVLKRGTVWTFVRALRRVSLGEVAPKLRVGTPFDANYVYFPDFTSAVYRCPLSGCTTPQMVGQGSGTPVSMATDATWIYWVTSTGNIVKAAK